jgi:hypothetical protein
VSREYESANEYGSTGSYMDAYNRRLDKGLSGSDVPQHVVATLLYDLHRFRGNRALDAFLGGWRVGVLEQRDCVCSGQRLLGSRMKESDFEAPPKPRVM